MPRNIETRKVAVPPLHATRLLDQLRERIRYLHYSFQTEKTYVYWARFFIRWHGRNGGMRHPRDMGQPEVEAFLSMLANERQVSPSTHRPPLALPCRIREPRRALFQASLGGLHLVRTADQAELFVRLGEQDLRGIVR